MTDTTANLALPQLIAAQAQKHITVNEALRALDALVQLAVLDRDLTSPPSDPAEGERWLVASGASGDWTGHDNDIAAWQDGGWIFYAPQAGWLAYVIDEAVLIAWDGSGWVEAGFGGSVSLDNVPLLGVGTTADETNPFSAKLNNALWVAKTAAEGGDGDLRYKLSKESAAHTLSMLLQDKYSGRAEIGLVGNDDLSFKVSDDGTTWKDALVLDRDTGAARFPCGIVHPATGVAVCSYIPVTAIEIWRGDASRTATPRTVTISSVSGTTITLSSAAAGSNGAWGRWSSMADVTYLRIWNTSKSPAQSAWVSNSATTTTLTVLNAAAIATWANGETIRLGDPNPTDANVLDMVALDISQYLQSTFGAVFRQQGVMLGLAVKSTNGPSVLDFSSTGANSSALGGNALSDGGKNQSSIALATSVQSPISNSNLIYVREQLGGAATDITTAYARILGVFV